MLSYSRIILENKEGKVLLQLRRRYSIQGGRWSLFGGRIRFNETKEEALVRELKEELDITIKNPKYLFTFYSYGVFPQHIFYASFNSKKVTAQEGEKAVFFSKEEMKQLTFALQLDKALERFFRRKKQSL